MVYGLCRLLLRDPTEAEDAAQQTFLSAHRALISGVVPRDEGAWLATIARNECRGRLRSLGDAPLPLLETVQARGEGPDDLAARAEQVTALKAALLELPEKQRDVVLLRDVLGFRATEIACAIGSSRPAVEALLFRGRRRLRGQLRPLRDVAGLAVPEGLRQALEAAVPSFAASPAVGTAAGVGLVKVAAPVAAALAVGGAGTVGVREHARSDRPAAVARAPAAAPARATGPGNARGSREPAAAEDRIRAARSGPLSRRVRGGAERERDVDLDDDEREDERETPPAAVSISAIASHAEVEQEEADETEDTDEREPLVRVRAEVDGEREPDGGGDSTEDDD